MLKTRRMYKNVLGKMKEDRKRNNITDYWMNRYIRTSQWKFREIFKQETQEIQETKEG